MWCAGPVSAQTLYTIRTARRGIPARAGMMSDYTDGQDGRDFGFLFMPLGWSLIEWAGNRTRNRRMTNDWQRWQWQLR